MIGLTTINGYPLPMETRFEKIKAAGFDSILLWWGNDEKENRQERVVLAEKHHLIIENVHAQTDNLNSLWLSGDEGEQTVSELITEIEACGIYGISTIVLHLTNGSAPPSLSEAGIKRIERLINTAEKMNVQIAFENIRIPQHTQYILDHYHSASVGLCYDSGHENYWTPEIDWLNLYGNRIFAIHLHDNTGNGDSHMIPFDGNIDWDTKLKALAGSSYQGSITLEAEYHHGVYAMDGFEAFLKKANISGADIENRIRGNRL